MGQSIDYRKLEIVSQFAGLLEILSKPEEIKALVKDAKTILAENKALLGPLAVKANLDTLLEREEADLEKKRERADNLIESARQQAESIVETANQRLEEAKKEKAETLRIKSECAFKEESIQKNLTEVENLKQVLVVKTQVLATEVVKVVQQQENLRLKEEKLKKVLGE